MSSRRRAWLLRLGAAVAGAAAFAGGLAALVATDNDASSAVLLAIGVALSVLAAVGGRAQIESFELFGAKVKVREVVRRRLADADAAARRDDARRAVDGRDADPGPGAPLPELGRSSVRRGGLALRERPCPALTRRDTAPTDATGR